MPVSGRERGASIWVNDPLLMSPDGHYQTGPMVYRHLIIQDRHWLGIFEAEHDGIGWFVVRTSCRPLVLLPGDFVHYRLRVEEDHGAGVMLNYEEDGRGAVTRLFKRSGIVFIEEQPGPVVTDALR